MPSTDANGSTDEWNTAEGALIDFETFNQIIEMDDEDDDSFSRGIVEGFFEQAGTTFGEMEDSIEKKDLERLSSLGHFLKGSSATLGLVRIREGCEKIQQHGTLKTADGSGDLKDEKEALDLISKILDELKSEYEKINLFFKHKYYAAPE